MSGRGIGRELTIAGALAVTLAVVFPIQVYLGNASLYEFSLVRMLSECTLVTAGLFAVVGALLVAFDRRLGGFPSVLFTAFLVCVYLEAGPFAFGLPELNGTQAPELSNVMRMTVDGTALGVVFVAILACFRKVRAFAHWVALGVLIMSVAAAFDIRRDDGTDGFGKTSGGCLHPQVAVLQSVRYSPVRNVLVFIVDSMTGPMCADMMRQDAELRAAFPGFVAYDNVGMADCTKRGIPGIMTGLYYGPDSSPSEYPMSSYGADSLLAPYLATDCPVYFVPDLMPYGCTNRKLGETPRPKGRQKRDWSALLRRSSEVPFLSVSDVVLFRTLPFALKADFVYAKIRHDPMHEKDESNFWHEHVMFRRLADAPVSEERKTALGIFHSWGSHMPRYFDDEGRPMDVPTNDSAAVVASSWNALRRLGRLMDALRAKCVYDRSTIIVCSDHANGNLPPQTPDRKSEERALLWVKPECSLEPFAFGDIPASTSKIAPLVKASVANALPRAEIENILRTDRRRFNGKWKSAFSLFHKGILFREWIIGPRGEVLETADWEN